MKAKRTPWTDDELAVLRACYPDMRTRDLGDRLNRPEKGVYAKAFALGLRKSPEFLSSAASGRLTKLSNAGTKHRFSKGHATWNKGMKGLKIGGEGTQFKKGRPPQEAHNYQPIGALRITRDGVLERKVTDDQSIVSTRRWRPVTRLVWEAANGPIPAGYVVRFKPGMSTTTEADITIDKLEMISKADNMRLNSFHNYPQPIPQLIQLKGAITRQINKRQSS